MKTRYKLIKANSNSVAPPDFIEIPKEFNTLDEISGIDVFGATAPLFKIVLEGAERLTVVSTRNEGFHWIYEKVEL